jgi:hypothetical protein
MSRGFKKFFIGNLESSSTSDIDASSGHEFVMRNIWSLLLVIFGVSWMILCIGAVVFLYILPRSPEPDPVGLLSPLQLECANQLAGRNAITFVDVYDDNATVGIGYREGKLDYAAIFRTDVDAQCSTLFHSEIFDCDKMYGDYCARVDGVEIYILTLTDVTLDGRPDVYVGFRAKGIGGRQTAPHSFYAAQSDGSFRKIFMLKMCPWGSNIEIKQDTGVIVATDDLLCDTVEGRKEHIEYSLKGGTATPLRDTIDP